jgi:hypothetical protein
MIAVGSHGLGRDRLALSGSISAALLLSASRPLLMLSPLGAARALARLKERDRDRDPSWPTVGRMRARAA